MTLVLERVGHRRLANVTLTLERGLHVVLGEPSDGTLELLALSAGDFSPRRGSIRLAGKSPHVSPELRRSLGSAFTDEPFEEHSVRQAVTRRLALREVALAPQEVFTRYGAESLLDRHSRTLTPIERRLVLLLIALATKNPAALLLHEPLLAGFPVATQAILSAIRDHAESCVVLCTTSSPRTSALLSPQALLLEDGQFKRGVLAATRPAYTPGGGACVRVECSDPGVLARGLGEDPSVSGIRWQEGDAILFAEGSEVAALCRTVLSVAVERDCVVKQMTQVLPEPVEIRATNAALARAAYERAHIRQQPADEKGVEV